MSLLSISTDFIVAALATWLGAVVATRAGQRREAHVFVWLALLLALWSGSRVVEAFTASRGVALAADGVQIIAAPFLIAATLHFALVLAGGRPPATLRGLLLAAYAFATVIGLLSATDRTSAIAIRPPYRPIFGLETPLFGWLWVGFRAVIVAVAVVWVWRAWRVAGPGGTGRERLTALLWAVLAAGVGGVITILLAESGAPEWPGVMLIAIGVGCATYAVFAGGLFLPTGAARRSFGSSVGTGVLTAAYVAALLGIERIARLAFAVETPLLTALALVLTIALFDPVREWVRGRFAHRSERHDRAYATLLGAIGGELLTATRPRDAIAPALTQLCRALDIRAAAVTDTDGITLATFGVGTEPESDAASALHLPLVAGPHTVGTLSVGGKRDREPYTPVERDRLHLAASYIATSLHVDERLTAQAVALDALATERAALTVRETALADALTTTTATPTPAAETALRVWALGPLKVERNGERIQRWGGAKAGTRQAEAMFAFLYDRAERGVAKDEFLEVIWPEVPLEKADLAFHRTLGGLRRMLEPHLTRGSEATTITYHNDRYRLDPATVAWSDVAEFRAHLTAASAAGNDDAAAIVALEAARTLYRGDYLDDCPIYGDSEYVEERRTSLRGRCTDALVALAELRERRGDVPAAAACFREALTVSGDDCPRAEAGLARLGVTV